MGIGTFAGRKLWLAVVGFALAIVVYAGCAVTSAAAAAPRAGAAVPLSSALRQDGTLRTRTGSFSAQGYQMTLASNGAPRFLKSPSQPPLAADSSWSENFGLVGLTSASRTVDAVAVSGTRVYVGGSFGTLGLDTGINYHNIAMWDGHAWHTLSTGTSGQVDALAVLGSDLFVGGAFNKVGAISASGVAMWNSAGWHALKQGVTNTGCCTPTVFALAATGTTSAPTVYVGGLFNDAGGQTVNNIATWNGSGWSGLAGGVTGGSDRVNALALSGSTLYVGGNFTHAGTVEANSLAAWSGSWSQVGGAGASNSSGYNGAVNALSVDPGTGSLYVGGAFAEVGGTFSAGGLATGATPATNVAEYDGSAWSAFGSGVTGTVNGLAYRNGTLYASGALTGPYPVMTEWNGTAWTKVGSGVDGWSGLSAVLATTSGGVIAVGGFSTAGGGAVVLNGIGLWTGSSWKGYGLGVNGTTLALAASGHNLYAAGSFTSAGWAHAPSIAHFNGSSWSGMGKVGTKGTPGACATSGVEDNICAIAIDPATGYVYVAGNFSAINNVTAGNVAYWNGKAWKALGVGVDGPVQTLLVYEGKLWAGGSFSHAGGHAASDIAKWNLSSSGWSAVGGDPTYIAGGGDDGDVNTLVADGQYVIVGGGFPELSDGTTFYPCGGLLLFDTSLTSFPTQTSGYHPVAGNNGSAAGVTDSIHAMDLAGSMLYIGGHFSVAGGAAANGFAAIDLSAAQNAYSAPGNVSGNNDDVNAIVTAGTSIYIAGSFTQAGTAAANDVAQYTPGTSTWSALGSGIGGTLAPQAYALAQSSDGLYIGGDIGLAGATRPSSDLGLWTATKGL